MGLKPVVFAPNVALSSDPAPHWSLDSSQVKRDIAKTAFIIFLLPGKTL